MTTRNIGALLLLAFALSGCATPRSSSMPIVIPTPWKIRTAGEPFKVTRLNYRKDANAALNEALRDFSRATGIYVNCATPPVPPEIPLLIDSANNAEVNEDLTRLHLLGDYNKLKPSGYILAVDTSRIMPRIVIAAKSAAGQYYGFTSLTQLFDGNMLTPVTIIDQPGFEQRGVVFGKIANFNKGPMNRDTKKFDGTPYLEYMKKYKLNFIWLAAWDNSYYWKTSLPIQEKTKKLIKAFLTKCKKYFITPSLSLRPYRQIGHPGREKGGVMYSSEQDIKGVADNLITLYNLGATNLYLTFDDQAQHQ